MYPCSPKGMYAFFGGAMASPVLIHASDLFGRCKLRAVPPIPRVFLPAWYGGYDSVSREWPVLLKMSCAKRGITGKQVTRMSVAHSARLSRIQCISQSPVVKRYEGFYLNSRPHASLSRNVCCVSACEKSSCVCEATYA